MVTLGYQSCVSEGQKQEYTKCIGNVRSCGQVCVKSEKGKSGERVSLLLRGRGSTDVDC